MKSGANLLKFGKALKEEISKIIADLPIGIDVHLVADQPVVVEHAVSGILRSAVRGSSHRPCHQFRQPRA